LLKSRGFWIGIGVSAVLIFLFVRGQDFGEVKQAFQEANYFLVAASLPVYFLGLWMRTIRWQYLLRPVKRVPALRLYPVVIIGLMANNLIPARVGELARAYVLGQRERISKTTSLGTIAVDRLFDGVTLVPMLFLVGAFAGHEAKFDVPLLGQLHFAGLGIVMSILFGIGIVFLCLLAFVDSVRLQAMRLVKALLPASLEDKVENLMNSFLDGLHALRSPLDLGVALFFSIVSWTLEATMYWMIALAFDIHEGFHVFLLLTAASNLAIAIVASQGGVGPFELVVKETLVAFGATGSLAGAYAIGLHAILLFPVTLIGLYLIWSMKLTFGDMLKRSNFDDVDPDDDALAAPIEPAQRTARSAAAPPGGPAIEGNLRK
jgi:uncharacterized protein (TIRG00374 family)